MSKGYLIQDQPPLREIYNEPPIISYKRAKLLRDILVRPKLSGHVSHYHELMSHVGLSTPSTDGLDQRSLKCERKLRSRVENFQGRV